MQITLIGAFVFILCLLFFANSTCLLYLLVFFSPFSAATILIIPGSDFGIQPSYFIGVVFVFRMLLKRLMGKITITGQQKFFLLLLGGFWLISLASLLYPVVLRSIGVEPFLLNPLLTESMKASDYSMLSLNHMIYMTFFMSLAVAVMLEIDAMPKMLTAIRVFLLSAFFTALWGIFVQLPSSLFQYPYPAWLFNNHPGYSQAWGSSFSLFNAFVPRINSVAPEPSMYAFFLMIVIGLLFVLTIHKKQVFHAYFQNLILIVLMITSLLSTSTTCLIGYVFMFFLALIFFFDIKKAISLRISNKLFAVNKMLIITLMVAIAVLILAMSLFHLNLEGMVNLIKFMTIEKMGGGSGGQRIDLFVDSVNIALDSWLLGTGWGSNRSVDLLSTLLANIGVLGLAYAAGMFLLFLHYAARLYYQCKYIVRDLAVISLALFFALSMALLLMVVAIPDFIFVYFWVILGLIFSLPKLKQNMLPKEGAL